MEVIEISDKHLLFNTSKGAPSGKRARKGSMVTGTSIQEEMQEKSPKEVIE